MNEGDPSTDDGGPPVGTQNGYLDLHRRELGRLNLEFHVFQSLGVEFHVKHKAAEIIIIVDNTRERKVMAHTRVKQNHWTKT
jgi:hypothetical protein